MTTIVTTIHHKNRTPEIMEWEADGYTDEPYGEAIAILLSDDIQMTLNDAVVLYTVTGEVLEFRRKNATD